MLYPHPEAGPKAPVSKDAVQAGMDRQEAGSAVGATGTREFAQAGMDQMSKKFIDMGAEVYVEADKITPGKQPL